METIIKIEFVLVNILSVASKIILFLVAINYFFDFQLKNWVLRSFYLLIWIQISNQVTLLRESALLLVLPDTIL